MVSRHYCFVCQAKCDLISYSSSIHPSQLSMTSKHGQYQNTNQQLSSRICVNGPEMYANSKSTQRLSLSPQITLSPSRPAPNTMTSLTLQIHIPQTTNPQTLLWIPAHRTPVPVPDDDDPLSQMHTHVSLEHHDRQGNENGVGLDPKILSG